MQALLGRADAQRGMQLGEFHLLCDSCSPSFQLRQTREQRHRNGSYLLHRLHMLQEQYAGQHVLVVGGGDSALEAASSVAEVGGGGKVILSYRGDAFGRAKPRNRERIAAAERSGRLQVKLKSEVEAIEPETIALREDGVVRTVRNDSVIISAGGILPSDFLRSIGIEIDTKYGTA